MFCIDTGIMHEFILNKAQKIGVLASNSCVSSVKCALGTDDFYCKFPPCKMVYYFMKEKLSNDGGISSAARFFPEADGAI